MAALQYFTLTGNLSAIVVDYVDAGTDPDIQKITATVEFLPRIPDGQLLWASGLTPKQGLALAKITARFDTDGTLKTIVGGSGVKMVANTDAINVDQLIYDVRFSNVVYNKADQLISPMAFVAPTAANTTVDMADLTWITPKPGIV